MAKCNYGSIQINDSKSVQISERLDARLRQVALGLVAFTLGNDGG